MREDYIKDIEAHIWRFRKNPKSEGFIDIDVDC